MEHQQQCIQLAHPSSSADATSTEQPSMCRDLYLAAFNGQTEEVMELLQQKQASAATDCHQVIGISPHGQCDILDVSAESNTVLHIAAEQGHHELIQELYARFKNQGLLSRQNSARDTPLHCAARAGHASAVKALIQLAQDSGESLLMKCKNEAGDTALHVAARHGHGEAAEDLVSAAQELAAELNNADVSPLYLAVLSGSVQALKAIIACKDASAVGPSSQNALHAAVFQSLEIVNLLLGWRPTLADQVDDSGSSPLHFASSDGDIAVVRAILDAAPPNTVYRKDSHGISALHVAARMGHRRVVKEILGRRPDAAVLRDNTGGTFVHAAAKEKRCSIVSLAIKKPMLRGLLDAPVKSRRSAVSVAIRNTMLRGLLDAQDRDGNTPLHLAVEAGAPGVVDALLRKGKVRADVLNKDGRTALDLAARSASVFTTVKLVVLLHAFGAQLRPQRQDNLEPWTGRDSIARGIEKSSDSLAVVAGLIATAAFAAGFNLPGGYDEANNKGKANLVGNRLFKSFLFLDMLAVAASVVALVLLVYGRASRSAGSWKSFAAALHCMWASLICLMLAFCAALASAASTKAVYLYGSLAIELCILGLAIFVETLIEPSESSRIFWRFMWQRSHMKGRRAIKRQYPLAGAYAFNWCLFQVTYFLGFIVGFGVISRLEGIERMGQSTSLAPSPM